MSRVKDPVEKKRLSLTKDHRVFALEGNKTFRKTWRLKKARAARQFRRAQTRDLQRIGDSPEEHEGWVCKPKRSLDKFGVMSLSQAISVKAGEFGNRWSSGVLVPRKWNKEALATASRVMKEPPVVKPREE
jgi:hypothetical protein